MNFIKYSKLMTSCVLISMGFLFINSSVINASNVKQEALYSDKYVDDMGNHYITIEKDNLDKIFPLKGFTIITIKVQENEKEEVLNNLQELGRANGYKVDKLGNMYTGKLVWTDVRFEIEESNNPEKPSVPNENKIINVNSPINKGGNIADISYIQVYWDENQAMNNTDSIFNFKNIKGNNNKNKAHWHKEFQSYKVESPKANGVYLLANNRIKITIDNLNKSAIVEALDNTIEIKNIHVKGGNSFNCYSKDITK